MKIGIIGSHGVGKTTVVNSLSHILQKRKHTYVVIEVVRELKDLGFPINENATFETQAAIQYYQRFLELNAENKLKRGECGFILCDRTVFDNYAYMMRKFGKQELFEKMNIEWNKKHPYKFLFKVPIWQSSIKKDNFRTENIKFQEDADQKLDYYLNYLKIPFYTIPKEIFTLQEDKQMIAFLNYFKEKLNL